MKNFITQLIIFLLVNSSGMQDTLAQIGNESGIVYVSPTNASYLNHPATDILVRFNSSESASSALQNNFSVMANGTPVSCSAKILDDTKTILIHPLNRLPVNAKISVSSTGKSSGSLNYYFYTTGKITNQFVNNETFAPSQNSNFYKSSGQSSTRVDSLVAGQIPLTVTANNHSSTGYYFISTIEYNPNIKNRNMILDANGKIIFDRTAPYYTLDFKKLNDNNFSYYNWKDSSYRLLDINFNEIDTIKAGNGYITDNHELQYDKNNGHYLLLAQETVNINMADSVTGGNPNARVLGLIIQELDQNKNVVFEWKTLDHLPVTASLGQNLTAANIDYIHCNSIEIESDTSLLLSSRHLCEITRIDRRTGAIIWHFGLHSQNNDFVFQDDTVGFTYQHDARRLPNGHITLFDDGNLRSGTEQYSRAIEYELDEVNKTAHLVWQYRNTPDVYSPFMGSVQRLPNGNSVIGWGGASDHTVLTEVDSNNQKVLEVNMPQAYSYRAFRFDIANIINSNQVVLNNPSRLDFCNTDSQNVIQNVSTYFLPSNPATNFIYESHVSNDTATIITKTDHDFYNYGNAFLNFEYNTMNQKDTLICKGSTVKLSMSGNCSNATYLWSTSDSSATVSVSPTITTPYWVDITSGNYTRRDTVLITVSEVPGFSISGVKLFSLPYQNETYFVPYDNTYKYSWSADRGTITSDPNLNSISFQTDSTFTSNITSVITNQNGCSNSAKFTVSYQPVLTGINNATHSENYQVYPNPTTGTITIEAKNNFDYQLYDLQGRVIRSSSSINLSGLTMMAIDDLPSGIYTLFIISGNNLERYKIEKL
ncbi:MAG: aryl-sulfate sulfotransferase [Bacteroidia bacterium]